MVLSFATWTVAVKNYGDKMSTFEQSEIHDFPDVWFLGLEGKKIDGVHGAVQNNGEFRFVMQYHEFSNTRS